MSPPDDVPKVAVTLYAGDALFAVNVHVVAVGFAHTPPPQPVNDAPLAGVSVRATAVPSE